MADLRARAWDTALVRSAAIIDLGSNTARLVVLLYQPGYRYQRLDELREVVRLSEGMGTSGILRAEPFERGIRALRTFRSFCDAVGVDDVRATATSAVRAARNGAAFVAAARDTAGVELEVLSGEQEARFGALAVANSLDVDDAVVFDLGGGSLQLSSLVERRFAGGGALPLGAVRMTEAFLDGDPPRGKALKALRRHVREALEPRLTDLPAGAPVVGMGGTLRNLASVAQTRSGYRPELLHGYRLERAVLEDLVDELAGMSVAQRRDVKGLNGDRADIIVAGGTVIAETLSALATKAVRISGQGLREGLFYPYLFPDGDHLAPDLREFSALNLMREYYDYPAHNLHVRLLALQLFDQLRPLHGLGDPERELLGSAALVHDIGMAVDYYAHHKHGMYLVMGRALPGYSHREQVMVALMVRYHRRGSPADLGLGGVLEAGDMERLAVLAGLLRLAEYLERRTASCRSRRCRRATPRSRCGRRGCARGCWPPRSPPPSRSWPDTYRHERRQRP
jgi:exopolyphosphatase / guanosine-5'-triphosphate,3'-diphosphate pyrophosphatase